MNLVGWLRHGVVWAGRLGLVLGLAACAASRPTNAGVVSRPVTSASSALWLNPPTEWRKVRPAPRVFAAQTWLRRLVCANGEWPRWRLTRIRPPVEDYLLHCPNQGDVEFALDGSKPAPDAPVGFRLLTHAGLEHFLAAMRASERQDVDAALAHLEAALALEPDEPVYRAARASIPSGNAGR